MALLYCMSLVRVSHVIVCCLMYAQFPSRQVFLSLIHLLQTPLPSSTGPCVFELAIVYFDCWILLTWVGLTVVFKRFEALLSSYNTLYAFCLMTSHWCQWRELEQAMGFSALGALRVSHLQRVQLLILLRSVLLYLSFRIACHHGLYFNVFFISIVSIVVV